jgi:acyl-CoA synthetase (AMP-forming)/AMP-acid ligase II
VVKRTSPADRAGLDLSSWEVASTGSELVRGETVDTFSKAFAAAGFRREAFYPCYGLAEATLIVSGGARGAEPARAADETMSCGEPVAGTRVAIVDTEAGTEVSDGQPGEVWVAGPGVAPGYWGRDEESEPVFAAKLPGDTENRRFLRTGDLGYIQHGELYVTGRIADLIVAGGQAHHATAIERAATDAVPALRTGCAAAFQVELKGQERVALVSEIRAGADPQGAIEDVLTALEERFGIAVGAVALIAPRTIPRTTSGKIRRAQCRALLGSGELAAVSSWTASSSAANDG